MIRCGGIERTEYAFRFAFRGHRLDRSESASGSIGAARSAADVFESLRSGLASTAEPVLFKSRKVQGLRVEFAEASAAVEEVNRVHGLALVVDHCAHAGRDYTEVTAQVRSAVEARRPAEGDCFAAFPPL